MSDILSQFRTDKTYNKTITISSEYRKNIFTATENCFVYIGIQASSANKINRMWLRITDAEGTQVICAQMGSDNIWRWGGSLAYYMHPGEKVEYVVNVSGSDSVSLVFFSNVDLQM